VIQRVETVMPDSVGQAKSLWSSLSEFKPSTNAISDPI